MGLFMVVATVVTRWSYFVEVCWLVPACSYHRQDLEENGRWLNKVPSWHFTGHTEENRKNVSCRGRGSVGWTAFEM